MTDAVKKGQLRTQINLTLIKRNVTSLLETSSFVAVMSRIYEFQCKCINNSMLHNSYQRCVYIFISLKRSLIKTRLCTFVTQILRDIGV